MAENFYQFEIIRWVDNRPHSDTWETPASSLPVAWARLISAIADSPNAEFDNVVAMSVVSATDVNGDGLLLKTKQV